MIAIKYQIILFACGLEAYNMSPVWFWSHQILITIEVLRVYV